MVAPPTKAPISRMWPGQFFEIQTANHAPFGLRDPERISLWRMFPEPRQTRFDRGRLKLGCHHARRYSGVVNLDDRGQVGLNSIANDHFVRDTVSHHQSKLDNIASFQ